MLLLPWHSGYSYESFSIPRANSGQDYVSQVWMTIFGHPANLMRQTFPSLVSPASPGHWVLEYSGGGEAEEYKTGAFHLSPTVSRLSPSCKLWSALKQVFTPSKNRMSEYFDGDQYMKRLADREKAIPRDSPLLIQVSVGVCLFVTTKKRINFKIKKISQCDLSLRPSVPNPLKVGNNHNSLWSIALHSSPLNHLQRFLMLWDSFSN